MKPRKPTQHVTDAQKAIKAGDNVILTDDSGIEHKLIARSDAYQIEEGMSNAGMWAIFVTGRAGYWLLDRVRPG